MKYEIKKVDELPLTAKESTITYREIIDKVSKMPTGTILAIDVEDRSPTTVSSALRRLIAQLEHDIKVVFRQKQVFLVVE